MKALITLTVATFTTMNTWKSTSNTMMVIIWPKVGMFITMNTLKKCTNTATNRSQSWLSTKDITTKAEMLKRGWTKRNPQKTLHLLHLLHLKLLQNLLL